ncbi:MAG: cytidine deaminase [Blastocatellia bacterium]|nr:cytidine deaminase [Blastocatellia bacterium]
MKMKIESSTDLVKLATEARENAIAPYSGFRVGAALLATDGSIYTGCNIENSTLGLTLCAERVALLKALSEGKRHFEKVTVVTDTRMLTPPCGSCRQMLWEFCGDVEVEMANLNGEIEHKHMAELLPSPFDRRHTDG